MPSSVCKVMTTHCFCSHRTNPAGIRPSPKETAWAPSRCRLSAAELMQNIFETNEHRSQCPGWLRYQVKQQLHHTLSAPTCDSSGRPSTNMQKQTSASALALCAYRRRGCSSTTAVSSVCTLMHSVPSPSSSSMRKKSSAHSVGAAIRAIAAGYATNASAVPATEQQAHS